MLTRQDKLRGKRLAREKEGEGTGRGGTLDSWGGGGGGGRRDNFNFGNSRKKEQKKSLWIHFSRLSLSALIYAGSVTRCGNLVPFGCFGRSLGIFFELFNVRHFCAKVLLSGGDFLWRPYLVLGAFLLTIGLFFTPINWSHCTPANKKFVMTGPFSKRAQ